MNKELQGRANPRGAADVAARNLNELMHQLDNGNTGCGCDSGHDHGLQLGKADSGKQE